MKKSIILEGPNGAFKSTIGNELKKHFGLNLVHAGPNPGGTIDAVKACEKQNEFLIQGVILDRCTPISRPIYDHDCIPGIEAMLLGLSLNNMLRNAIIVYCTGEGEFTNKDYYPEGHFEKISEERRHIRSLYDDCMKNIPHIVYDGNNFESVLEKVNEELYSI